MASWSRQSSIPCLRAETGNIEGQGYISAIQFHAGGPDPTPFTITWRGVASVINDPVSMVADMFTTRGNWTMADFDPITLAQGAGIAAANSAPVHWVFFDDQTYGQILVDLFENYLTDIALNAAGQLTITWPSFTIRHNDIAQPYLDAAVDCEGDDPEDSVVYRLAQENLVNEVVMRSRHNWSTNGQVAEFTYSYLPSQHAYKSRKPRNFTLKGVRTEAHAYAWLQYFLSPLVELPATVDIPLKALLPYFHMQQGSLVALTWSAGPDVLGRGWTNRILRVLETSTDYLLQRHALKCFDTGLSVVPPQAVPFRAQNNSLWYLLLKEADHTLEFASTLTFPWVSSGAERHWVTRVTPNGQTV